MNVFSDAANFTIQFSLHVLHACIDSFFSSQEFTNNVFEEHAKCSSEIKAISSRT